jgi:3-methyladenine DNA glycosylase AlkD
MPALRRVARRNRDASLEACRVLLAGELHEHRLAALVILRERFERGDRAERERIADLYLAGRVGVDNWDLVDASAPYLLADRVRRSPRRLLDPLARSDRVWDRRIAVLATFSLIREGEFRQTIRLAERLLGDPEDLIHKAVGWMLREIGKRDEATLCDFLDRHAERMPRTMLRYSIERLPAPDRRRYLGR